LPFRDIPVLRRSYREDGKVKSQTPCELSQLPHALIDILRRSLQGLALAEDFGQPAAAEEDLCGLPYIVPH
jgi:hypothetical protein